MSEKIRIHELAKELNMSSKDVITLLSEKLNIQAKSHASAVSKEDVEKLKKAISEKPAKEVKKEPVKPLKQAVKAPARKEEIKEPVKKEEAKELKKFPEKIEKAPEEISKQADVKKETPEGKYQREKTESIKKLQAKIKQKKDREAVIAPKKEEKKEEERRTEIVINKPISVGKLAAEINVSNAEAVKFLMLQGIMATVNQTIDVETAKKLAENFGMTVLEKEKETEIEHLEEKKPEDKNLKPRAPVVTIMGHVDHGKTTLLDAIRATKHKIVTTEVGGITQSIGAYTAHVDDNKVVFIDTPGHEAFTEMRARGAQATDIAILVVAADDGIMPQTVEALNHAKAAKVPIIVAVNKIDKPDADPDRVLQQLTEHGLVPEKWGGQTVTVEVSALQGLGLDELLEYILLVAELEDLKANPDKNAEGIIIEAKLDKGKGPVATVLVQNGTLKVGDCVVAGKIGGKVRALLSDEGERVKQAGPSTPVEILGLTEVPQAGDKVEVVENEKEMKSIIEERRLKEKESKFEALAPAQVRREMMLRQNEETKDLNVIIKANTHGSAEAVSVSIQQIKSNEVFMKIVHIGVGDISEADVMLAAASNAIIIGFSVKTDTKAKQVAEDQGVAIRTYDIIYQILEDIEKTMLGLLQPEIKEVEIGKAEIRQVFTVGKTVKIAGCYILEGKASRNAKAVIMRDGKELIKTNISQLKRFKEDVKEVNAGYECGLSFEKFNDIQEGDIVKFLITEKTERETLV